MKKLLFLLAAAILVLSACGEVKTEQPKEIEEVETEGNKDDSIEDEVEEISTYNKVLLDSDNAKVTFGGIAKVKDKYYDKEYYAVKLDIENKLHKTIEVQAREVSADDLMVDDKVFFSETVAGGKKANGQMEIGNYDGNLPSLEKNLELKLMILNGETFRAIEEPVVKIEIK